MKKCIEDIEHLRFKLKMFGIPLSEYQPVTLIFCDNEAVCKITPNVESSFNKKHSAIKYHFAIWNVADGVCKIAWIPTGGELADATTKILSIVVQDHLFGICTY